MSRTALSICLTAVVALVATPAISDTPPTGQVPQGSYLKTCTGAKMEGYTLYASCRKMDGAMMNASLDQANGCTGDVGNVNGILVCTGAVGSYFRTCRDVRIEGNTLYGVCQMANGAWRESPPLENFQGFQGNINNCNGVLKNGDC